MITDERDILEKLQQAVTAAVEAANAEVAPAVILAPEAVKYVGRSQTPPQDQKWLEIVHIPNTPDNQYWGDEVDHMGMMRLILHWPNNEEGAYPPIDTLAAIAKYFVKDRFIAGVKITNAAKLLGVLEQGNETLYPASIRFQSFRQGA